MYIAEKNKLISSVSLYSLPVGKLLDSRTIISRDKTTLVGVRQIEEILQNKNRGLAVFFAHLGLIDLFSTSIAIEKIADFKAIFPIAGSWFHFPFILNSVFKSINNQVKHEFIPVYRKEELGRSDSGINFLDFSGLSEDEKKEANRKYVEKTLETLNNGNVVVVAPYAGRAPKESNLRQGPVALLRTQKPIVFAFTKWNWKRMNYVMYFSEIYTFSNDISVRSAHKKIYSEYLRMAGLANITSDQLINAKSDRGITTKAWKLFTIIYLFFNR